MISNDSHQFLIWLYRVANWLMCSPLLPDIKKEGVTLLKEDDGKKRGSFYFCFFSSQLHITVQMGLICFQCYIIRFGRNIESEEIILAMVFISGFSLSIASHLLTLLKSYEIKLIINSILSFNHRLGTCLVLSPPELNLPIMVSNLIIQNTILFQPMTTE